MKPADLPLVREQTIAHGEELWPTIYLEALLNDRQFMRPAGMSASDAARLLAQREVNRLRVAELYHVSEAMTDLATMAADSMPEFTLQREDLPSDYGLIVFEHPIAVNDQSAGAPAFITAAAWGMWVDAPRELCPDGGVWVTWYTDRDLNIESAVRSGLYDRTTALQASSVRAPLVLENEIQIPFRDEAITHNPGNLYTRAALILRTTWTLMQQTALVAQRTEVPPRAAQRRLTDRREDLMRVRVVTLRAASSGEDARLHGNREYRHRWIVRGHWRQQWYASRGVHRPVWISPHIKGPEDAPILGGEKVYAWRR